ncbi:2OG-Fe(II) oxygenase [Brevibacillus agri]|uniref:2OG-Fe(II) oxygenase n=1 Tax=Brevibacillus TaxID=55080 RepID=UPI0004190E9F|nr:MULTISPECIES: 2OG-Fe(II) oxygenase [Brevibacillus]MCG5250878.1 2OG-Fe(II) oxygenase [Brevibacillus agri]QHZ55600.1 prolyl 4-hydroxylase subunit alpha [Brevibacillus sp. NSP2.1]
MAEPLTKRIALLPWEQLQHSLDEQGFAVLPPVLQPEECQELIATYREDRFFRATINMARYRFGSGEYRYYQAPLPPIVEQLREGFYPELAKTANRWNTLLGQQPAYPPSLSAFLARCHEHGQARPTPLLLKYEAGSYNCLHQDMYGDVFFPFQVVLVLSQQESDFCGGQFLLIEQRPRAQSRGHVITLEQGAGLIFPTAYRPVAGARGYYKTTLRHGVSTITQGTRYSLGIIFHDAK